MSSSPSRRQFAAGVAATLGSIAVIRSAARAAEFQYKYGNPIPADHPLNLRMTEAAEAIRQETKGRLDIKVFPNNMLGGDPAMLSQLRSGALQFFTLEGAILQSVVPVAGINHVGFAFKNSAEGFRAMDGELGAYVRKEISTKNLYAFEKMWANGMRQVTSSTHPIQSADDMAHFKIRTPPAPLTVDLFRSLGAAPSPINFSELYTALQTHIVDGQENPLAIIETAHMYEVQKYLSVTNHVWASWWMLANAEAWNAIPPDIQAVVTRNFAKYALLQRQDIDALNESLAAKLRGQGMIINTADTAAFRPRLAGFYRTWRERFGSSAWTLLEKYTGKLG